MAGKTPAVENLIQLFRLSILYSRVPKSEGTRFQASNRINVHNQQTQKPLEITKHSDSIRITWVFLSHLNFGPFKRS